MEDDKKFEEKMLMASGLGFNAEKAAEAFKKISEAFQETGDATNKTMSIFDSLGGLKDSEDIIRRFDVLEKDIEPLTRKDIMKNNKKGFNDFVSNGGKKKPFYK